MWNLCFILCGLMGLIFLVWISRHLMILSQKRRGFVLGVKSPGPPDPAPPLTVIVAAKDEEENIGPCFKSLLDQDYPNMELIACNDRSTDRTLDILRDLAAKDSRLKVINIDSLPQGWQGKSNAMQIGISQSTGEYVCMLDADCRLTSVRTFSAAMQYVVGNKVDMLSMLPTLEMKSFWENTVQPVCGGLMMIWFHPDKVNNPSKKAAYANGAFMFMPRKAYQAIGTHEAVKDSLNEDIHLAELVKQKGLNLKVVRNSGLFVSRMYTSLGGIISGWTRIFYGSFRTFRRIFASLMLLFTMSLLPYLLTILGFVLWGAGCHPSDGWLYVGLAGAAASAMQISVAFHFYAFARGRPIYALTYPLGGLVAFWCLVCAIGKLRKGSTVTWRGTSYTGSASAR
ncbi:MAG: glycosyltransferase [Planctomycetes bacterium]|nr:glycosyltransferase [Planctomycetota bacterium]